MDWTREQERLVTRYIGKRPHGRAWTVAVAAGGVALCIEGILYVRSHLSAGALVVVGAMLFGWAVRQRREGQVGVFLRRCRENDWSLPDAEREAMSEEETAAVRPYLTAGTRRAPLWKAVLIAGLCLVVAATLALCIHRPQSREPAYGVCFLVGLAGIAVGATQWQKATLSGLLQRASGQDDPNEPADAQ